ncbi:MAG: type III pantothenate kinase [Bacteroidales bacterium]
MHLVIDVGNSRVKIALMLNNEVIKLIIDTSQNLENGLYFLQQHHHIKHTIISSVRDEKDPIIQVLYKILPAALWLNHTTPLPIINTYSSQSTLGNDRLAAVVGAAHLLPQKNVLVIDAGTALTYDLINANGIYLGGNISPGIDMRFKALRTFTQKLPLCHITPRIPFVGTNTKDAVLAGVLNGVLYETEVNMQQFALKYSNLEFIFTGGDADFFANQLKKTIFVNHNLVLIGLNRILHHYATIS